MKNSFTLTESFSVPAEKIYSAWISTDGHTQLTGSPAKVDGVVKGAFTAWDGYIWGTFLELETNKRILQAWRTSEFPEDAEDSIVEIILQESNGETTLTLIHSNMPEDQVNDYKQGWEDFYFKPMRELWGE